LLATLSRAVLAETGYMERRGRDRGADDPGSWRAARGSRAAPLAAVVLLAAGLVAASSLLASAAAAQPLAGADSRHVAIGQSR